MFKKTGKTETISNPEDVNKDKKSTNKSDKTGILITEDGKVIKADLEDVCKDS